MYTSVKLIIASMFLLASFSVAAADQTAKKPEVLRVGGDYKVEAIEKLGDQAFRIEFKALNPTGQFDTLRLESDHLHVAVKVGQQLRLSAEILSHRANTAEVAQMVIFLPSAQGPVPVWLLSNKASYQDLRATKYLEMHVPLTDYMIM